MWPKPAGRWRARLASRRSLQEWEPCPGSRQVPAASGPAGDRGNTYITTAIAAIAAIAAAAKPPPPASRVGHIEVISPALGQWALQASSARRAGLGPGRDGTGRDSDWTRTD